MEVPETEAGEARAHTGGEVAEVPTNAHTGMNFAHGHL